MVPGRDPAPPRRDAGGAGVVVVVDYGAGNLGSVAKALRHLGAPFTIASTPEAIGGAARLVLPGVGSFGQISRALAARRLGAPLRAVIQAGTPYLGICLGLQVLFAASDEAPGAPGLGLLSGGVRRFAGPGLKVPHVGWNAVDPVPRSTLFRGIPAGAHFYFVHSYYAEAADASCVAATTDYGVAFASAVETGNLAAVQFHPEKSGAVGLRLLANWLGIAAPGGAA